jgi:hypothetical protein
LLAKLSVDLAAGAGAGSSAQAGPTLIASVKSMAATMDDLVIMFLLIVRVDSVNLSRLIG